MNKNDSERIAGFLKENNYQKASKIEKADLVVLNMCSVRQSAVDRVYGLAPKLKKIKAKTILTGCFLKKDAKNLSSNFDHILGIKDLADWFKKTNRSYFKIKPEYQSFPIGYVPISTGCNNFCSYCVVPRTRGPEFNRPAEEIIKEAENLIKKDYKEIWLLGQNVNSYKYRKINFPSLLRKVADIKGDFWLRFTSPHPKDFSDDLIKVMKEKKKITPYLNLPLQSGDNEILRRMNRKYDSKYYLNLVKKIRKIISDIALSTDIIVGFPGETKKQFRNTVRIFKKVKYDMAYISQYSPRPETKAEKIKDNISKEEKEKREKILTRILIKTAAKKNEKFLNKTIKVLTIKKRKDFFIGKSFHNKTVKFKKGKIGEFSKVKITKAFTWGLKGIN